MRLNLKLLTLLLLPFAYVGVGILWVLADNFFASSGVAGVVHAVGLFFRPLEWLTTLKVIDDANGFLTVMFIGIIWPVYALVNVLAWAMVLWRRPESLKGKEPYDFGSSWWGFVWQGVYVPLAVLGGGTLVIPLFF